jgi:hypothetical protein
MHDDAPLIEFGLDLVKNEFAEAFVRSAAAKRTVDPTSTLTAVETEAVTHLSRLIVELREGLQEDEAAGGRRKRNRRYLAHASGTPKRHSIDASRGRDAATAIELIEKLGNQSITSAEATRLIELLRKLDLRRRAVGRYEEIAATDRALGF